MNRMLVNDKSPLDNNFPVATFEGGERAHHCTARANPAHPESSALTIKPPYAPSRTEVFFHNDPFISNFQMRIVILYAYNWHNMYFDQVVLVLTTLDPLINHCVCLWTMRKYRDGYASSLGKVFSCFKPSEEGMFRSAITRISSISRRSFSRTSSSARSSSMRTSRRKSCKFRTYPYL